MSANDENPGVQEAHERIDEAAERVEQGAHRATEAGADAAHRAADAAEDWRERGAESGSSARDRMNAVLADVRAFTRDHPLESVAAAVAAGWLMGRLFTRLRG